MKFNKKQAQVKITGQSQFQSRLDEIVLKSLV